MAHFLAWLIFTAIFSGLMLLMSWVIYLVWSASPLAATGICFGIGAFFSLLFIANN